MWSLQEELLRVEIGQPLRFQNLTTFPLVERSTPTIELDYILLEDGVKEGKVRVTEIHAGGSVPELRLENTADLPVLLVDGEELVGAKQNRVLNLTILAPAKRSTVIPVSCVEAGRWGMTSPDLRPADHVMYSRVRGQRVSHVTESMRSCGSHRSDQGAVWRDIAAKAIRLNAMSPTGAMSAIYERHASSVKQFARAFAWKKRQRGIAFAIGDRILGLDLFDHPEVMGRFFQKLVSSYALDALDESSSSGALASEEALTEFVTRIGATQSFADRALGLGKDVRFNGPEISGAALWAQERYVHICAFARKPEDSTGSSFWTRISRPSHRRMF